MKYQLFTVIIFYLQKFLLDLNVREELLHSRASLRRHQASNRVSGEIQRHSGSRSTSVVVVVVVVLNNGLAVSSFGRSCCSFARRWRSRTSFAPEKHRSGRSTESPDAQNRCSTGSGIDRQLLQVNI